MDYNVTGCIASECEGWFNPWSLHSGLLKKAQELGAVFINGEVIGFDTSIQKDLLMEGVEAGTYKKLDKIKFKSTNGEEREIKFAICILASGEASAEIAKLANIGTGKGLLSIDLPIKSR